MQGPGNPMNVEGTKTEDVLFFIVGSGRSGSSWLAKMLDAHPEILCRYEGHFCGGQPWASTSRTLYHILLNCQELRGWFYRGSANQWTLNRDFREDALEMARIVALWMMRRELAKTGKRILGDKSIPASLQMKDLHRMFPQARIIHLIRDGRDFAVSFQFRTWFNQNSGRYWHFLRDFYRYTVGDPEAPFPDPDKMNRQEKKVMTYYLGGYPPCQQMPFFSPERLRILATIWKTLVEKAREGKELFGGNYLEVRYEDLIESPEETLVGLLNFLNANTKHDVISKCIEENRFKVHRFKAEQRERGFMDPHFYRKGQVGDWKNYFSDTDRQVFYEVAGDVLLSCGYEIGSIKNSNVESVGSQPGFITDLLVRLKNYVRIWHITLRRDLNTMLGKFPLKVRRALQLARQKEAPHEIALYVRQYLAENDQFFDGGLLKDDLAQFRCCAVCDQTENRPVFGNSNGFQYVQCAGCGFVYMNPIIDEEKLIDIYRYSESKRMYWNYNIRHATIRKSKGEQPSQQIQELLRWQKGGRLLDVGCGIGNLLDEAKFYYDIAEGIELDEGNVKFAREERGLKIYTEPLERLEFPVCSYDIVTMLQVIEHLADPRKVVEEIHKILRPGGILHISCPNIDGLSFRLFKDKHILLYGRDHVNMFNRTTITQLLRSVGFEIVDFYTHNSSQDILFEEILYYVFKLNKFFHRWSTVNPLVRAVSRHYVSPWITKLFNKLNKDGNGNLGTYLTVVARK